MYNYKSSLYSRILMKGVLGVKDYYVYKQIKGLGWKLN